ncbi:EamA family transporter [Brevibacillus laterosporus]|nr:EamA family transporter [Brevibacillus laterosporus]
MVLPILFGLVYMTERNVKIRLKDIPAFLLAALVGISLYQTLFVASLRYTTASNSSLLIAMSPLFTVIGLLLTKKEKATPTLVIGSFVAVMGVFVIKGLGDVPFQFSWDSLRGDIVALLASCCLELWDRESRVFPRDALHVFSSSYGYCDCDALD